MRSASSVWALAAALACACGGSDDGAPEPFEGEVGTLMFATQVPVEGFALIDSMFSNHSPGRDSAPRGGDLMIRYPDGTLRNLTREAGFGEEGEVQGESAIAVREPCVHWSGNKALFSMVIGGGGSRWQLYEVTGLARDQEASIRRIESQPEQFNNVSPAYGSDDRILFASDRPRGGEMHLYPQLDEYESQPTVVGIYRLDESSGDLELIEHSPSGVFHLTVDSFGRVIFVKWDHLQRDQQGDGPQVAADYGPITFADESPGASSTTSITGAEVFPESRGEDDPDQDPTFADHTFNHFFPWEVNQDGSAEETLNHVGRQEWGGTFTRGSIVGDDSLDFEAPDVRSAASIELDGDAGTFYIRQDPTDPQYYTAIHAGEFDLGGPVIRFQGDPAINPEEMELEQMTAGDLGRFRSPIRLVDGTYVATHTDGQGTDGGAAYRLVALEDQGAELTIAGSLTAGITRTVTSNDDDGGFSGVLWEMDVVEVAPRDVPPLREEAALPEVEQAIFDDVGVDPGELAAWLRERELAMVVSRNVTQRDRNDIQQPYSLAVPGGVSSAVDGATVYDVSHLQFFQGDQLRGYESHTEGRRLLARPMHGADLVFDPGGPDGAVAVGLDGSMAAFVPARRAMSWQLVAPDGQAVVRERNWVSFRAGEIRVCVACHGINRESQTGQPPPENPPAALRPLLEDWLATQ